jgi:hypothetical protein
MTPHSHSIEVRHCGIDGGTCRLGDRHDGCCPDTPGCDMPGVTMTREEMIAALAAAGYKVTKARATRRSVTTGDNLAGPCVHDGTRGWHSVRLGRKATKTRGAQAFVCDDCYRFGASLHSVPNVPAEPIRAARLFHAWRRAHHRYARRYAVQSSGWFTGEAERFAGRILIAIQRQAFVRTLDAARLSEPLISTVAA